MRPHGLVPIALAFALGGCGGGGGSGAPVAPISGPVAPSTATFALSFVIPNRTAPATSTARAPRYTSPGTASVAVYDGATLIYVANYSQATQFTTVYGKTGTTTVTSGSCAAGTSSQTCTLTISTSIGAHAFDVVTYPVSQGTQAAPSLVRSPDDVGTIPTFTGVILAEGELAVTLTAGTNPGQTITLLGVADRAAFGIPGLTLRLNGTGPLVGIIGTSYTVNYTINDSSNVVVGGYQIVQPGDYDNGPVTIAETDGNNIVTMTPISQSTPPASAGAQSFSVTCQNNGTATITAAAKTKPNTAYASGLTYSATNYPTGTIGTTTLQCVPNSATQPVTVQ
ncbi:MAG TPA: hypothetical protein VN224_02625 [Xanthomonadales bacterium]|nr:hypothetical protein [Xanthomonadales bacterium]